MADYDLESGRKTVGSGTWCDLTRGTSGAKRLRDSMDRGL